MSLPSGMLGSGARVGGGGKKLVPYGVLAPPLLSRVPAPISQECHSGEVPTSSLKGLLRNGPNGKKSNLKVKNTVCEPSYLQCRPPLDPHAVLEPRPMGATLGWEGGESSC